MDYLVVAKGQKDIPEWLSASEVTKLKKLELKVKMSCNRCEEKVEEEIRKVHGVFDVKTDRNNKRVTVWECPGVSPSHKELLKRARKVYRKAKFMEPSTNEEIKDKEVKGVGTPSEMTEVKWVISPLIGPGYLVPLVANGSSSSCSDGNSLTYLT